MKLSVFINLIVLAGLGCFAGEVSASNCKIEKQAELPLGYANGVATVEAKIEGKAVVFGIDTGAQTVVTPETAEKLGLLPGLRRTLLNGTTATTIAGQVTVRDFEFAGEHYLWKDITKVSLPKPAAPDPKFKAAAGLIGMDILGNYDFDFDFPHRKLTLYKIKGCATVPPPDYENLQVIAFKFNEGRNILFPVDLDGKKITAILDTGAVLNMITRIGVKKVRVTEDQLKADPVMESTGIGNVTRKHPLHKFNTLTIGGAAHSNVPFGVVSRPLGQADALIGQLYLFTRRFRVSSATHTLYVENRQAAPSVQSSGSPSPLPPLAAPPKALTMTEACRDSEALRQMGRCSVQLGQPAPDSAPSYKAVNAPTSSREALAPAAPGTAVPLRMPGRVFTFGFLGVEVSSVSEGCGKAMEIAAGTAVLVRSFSAISPGEKAGLRRGDIITVLNGQPVLGETSFLDAINKNEAGQTVKLTVLRAKQETIVEAVLAGPILQPADQLDLDAKALQQIEAEKAIQAALPADGCIQERALSQVLLGGALGRRHTPSGLGEYRERAIENLEQGLAVLDRMKFAKAWGIGQINLGHAYRRRSFGDRLQNIEKSIQAYETALAIPKDTLAGIEKGRAFMGLGLALLNRGLGKRPENMERAIENLHAAEREIYSQFYPKDWGELHRALGNAYANRFGGLHEQNIAEAIAALEQALTAYSESAFPNERKAVLAQLAELKAQQPAEPAHN